MNEPPRKLPSRAALLAALCVLTPLGFATKHVHGPLGGWFQDYAGGVVYVMFWMLLALWLRPSLPPARVAWVVLALTSALEVLQLWSGPVLDAIRRTYLGRALIGDTFSAWDFVHYAIGCALAVALVQALPGTVTRCTTPRTSSR